MSTCYCFVIVISALIALANSTYVGKACSVITQLDDCGLLYCKCPGNNTGADLDKCVGQCAVCDDRSQCILGADARYQSCSKDESLSKDNLVCTTKRLIEPFLTEDWVTGIIAFFCGMFASGAGIGGGGLFVPLFVLTGWGKRAVERSLAATTGLSVAMMIMIAPRRHPDVARPQIDYPTMLLLEPIVLLGTVPGKLLNKIMPTTVVYIMLLVLLLVVSVLTWLKYNKFRKKEIEKAKEEEEEKKQKELDKEGGEKKEEGDENPSETLPPNLQNAIPKWLPSVPCGGAIEMSEFSPPKPGARRIKTRRSVWINATTLTTKEGMEGESANYQDENKKNNYFGRGNGPISAELKEVYDEESKMPWTTIALLLGCWVVVLVLSVIIKTTVECNGAVYWVLNVLFVPSLAAFTVAGALLLHRKNKRNEELGYHYAPMDLKWTTKNLITWPIVFIIAGIMSSLLGIGGGMVIAPLLLETGMNPVVSSSTTACMTLFTSSSAAIQFMIISTSTWDYFLYYVAISFVAGLIGRFLINAALAKTGKQSIVVAVLASLITLALVAMGYVSIKRIIDSVSAGSTVEMEALCASVEQPDMMLTTLAPNLDL